MPRSRTFAVLALAVDPDIMADAAKLAFLAAYAWADR